VDLRCIVPGARRPAGISAFHARYDERIDLPRRVHDRDVDLLAALELGGTICAKSLISAELSEIVARRSVQRQR
jgi:hypothetical protein